MPLHDNTQHSHETDVHAFGGIRTRIPSKRASTNPRLRQRDLWGRCKQTLSNVKSVHVTGPVVIQRMGRGIALLFHDNGIEVGEWSAARPGRTLPPGKTRYPLYRRLGGPQGQSGRAENIAPSGFDSPDLPARSQSLYRLSYPAQTK